jgi:putative ABC transport system permease protein
VLEIPFFRDFLYGLRLLRRSPAFYLLGILILSLGIGATTAIFSLIDGVLLHPLPYRDPARLAVIWSDFSRQGGNSRALTAPALFFDWRDRSRSFDSLAAFTYANPTFTALDQPITPPAHMVTANFFDTMGVPAFRGRTFLADEGLPGKDDVAVISYSLWRSVLGGAESAVGSRVELDGRSVRIVGILPPGYRPPNNGITVQPDVFLPSSFENQRMERLRRSMVIVGRLRDGASVAEARGEIASITGQAARAYPEGTTPPASLVNAIRDDLMGEFRGPFFLLQCAVGIMLLIACANVANLLLARYSARGYEFSVRTAIGASRGQIVRQLFAENLLVSGLGGIGGILFAAWSLRPMLALVPAAAGLPFADQVHISPEALALALGLSLLSSILFGMAPARQASRSATARHLGDAGRSRSAGRVSALWRNALIAAEIGLSLILIASAGPYGLGAAQLLRSGSGQAARDSRSRGGERGQFSAPTDALRAGALRSVRTAAGPGARSVRHHTERSSRILRNDPHADREWPLHFRRRQLRCGAGRGCFPVGRKALFSDGQSRGAEFSFEWRRSPRMAHHRRGERHSFRGTRRPGSERRVFSARPDARIGDVVHHPHPYNPHGGREDRGARPLELGKVDERISDRAARRASVR